ncbi:MAG: SPOR domain-containing protein, partial [Hyphomonadaceae bacterium]
MRHDRRAYAPPPGYVMYAPDDTDDQPRRGGVLMVVMFVILAAFGGFVWSLYGVGETPRIVADGAYKIQPPPGSEGSADPAERSTLNNVVEGVEERQEVVARAPPEEPMTRAEQLAPPPLALPSQAPRFSSGGAFVAQIAALRTEEAATDAWRRLAIRSPHLFSQARMDVQRADLGAGGIYYRVRAGFFAD